MVSDIYIKQSILIIWEELALAAITDWKFKFYEFEVYAHN